MSKAWARRAHVLTCVSLLSSAAGFVAQVILAKSFGVSAAVDAYFFSMGAPVFLGGLIAGAINFFLTPELRRVHSIERSTSHAPVLRLALLLNMLTIAVAIVGLPLQVLTLPSASPIRAQTVLPWLLAGAWLFAGALVHQSVVSALLASRDRLVHAATLPLLPPLCSALLMLAAGERLGVASMLAGQLLGSFVAIAHASVLCRGASAGTASDPVAPLLRLVLIGLPSAAAAMACFSAYPLIDSVLAPRAGDHVMSQISYAQRVIIGLGTLLVAAPLAMATNQFADLARQGDLHAFLARYRTILRLSLVPAAVLAVLLIFAGDLVVGLLFGRGRFGNDEVRAVGLATSFMAPGMLLMLLTSLTFRAAFALRGGPRAFALVGILWVISYSVLGTLLLRHGVVGLAASYSLSWLLASALAWMLLHRLAAMHFTSSLPD